MVGDSFKHDVEGALRAGMRGVLLHRGDTPTAPARPSSACPVISSLRELPGCCADRATARPFQGRDRCEPEGPRHIAGKTASVGPKIRPTPT